MRRGEPALLMMVAHDDRWRISVTGEVDASARRYLCSLAEVLRTSGDPVDFDLGRVTFVDRAGWGAICAAADLVRTADVEARIVNPSPAVRRLTDLLSNTAAVRGAPRRTPRLVPVA